MPGFSLRGVNHLEALETYQSNPNDLSFPSETQSLNNGLIGEQIQPRKDHSGVIRYMATTSSRPATECVYCGESLSKITPMGVPVDFEDFGKDHYRIWIEAYNLCSFDCMLSHINLYKDDPNYRNSANYAIFWHSKCYPGENIQTFDRRNLIRYSGAQDRKSIRRFVFSAIPNLELAFRGSVFST